MEKEVLLRTWPGNIRQLSWCVAQALGATAGPVLAALPPDAAQREGSMVLPLPGPGTLEAMLGKVSHAAAGILLRRAMESRGHDPAAAAQDLGLTPRALAKALRDHGIPLEDE